MRFTALLHHVNIDLLRRSYYDLKRQAAAGVDGVTWQEYGNGLEERLADLHGRIHRGAYRARPSRRVWIDKDDGRKRPLGIAALEDKILQAAVVVIIGDFDIDRSFRFPSEADSKLIVDSNVELAFAAAAQRFQPVAAKCSQVFKGSRRVEPDQASSNLFFDVYQFNDALAGHEPSARASLNG